MSTTAECRLTHDPCPTDNHVQVVTRFAVVHEEGRLLCGCDLRRGLICGVHCQIQGCPQDGSWHTDHCIQGVRVEPTDRTWFHDEEVPR